MAAWVKSRPYEGLETRAKSIILECRHCPYPGLLEWSITISMGVSSPAIFHMKLIVRQALKAVGAAAQAKKSFERCVDIGKAVNDSLVTIGSALDH